MMSTIYLLLLALNHAVAVEQAKAWDAAFCAELGGESIGDVACAPGPLGPLACEVTMGAQSQTIICAGLTGGGCEVP